MLTFKKDERLCSKKLINELSYKGFSFVIYPIKLVWIDARIIGNFPAQILFSVPKKNFPKSVERNKIKRQLRECYRKNKSIIYSYLENNRKQCAMMLIYIGKSQIPYLDLESKIILTLHRLIKEYERGSN